MKVLSLAEQEGYFDGKLSLDMLSQKKNKYLNRNPIKSNQMRVVGMIVKGLGETSEGIT
jgi:hypothetical protein